MKYYQKIKCFLNPSLNLKLNKELNEKLKMLKRLSIEVHRWSISRNSVTRVIHIKCRKSQKEGTKQFTKRKFSYFWYSHARTNIYNFIFSIHQRLRKTYFSIGFVKKHRKWYSIYHYSNKETMHARNNSTLDTIIFASLSSIRSSSSILVSYHRLLWGKQRMYTNVHTLKMYANVFSRNSFRQISIAFSRFTSFFFSLTHHHLLFVRYNFVSMNAHNA